MASNFPALPWFTTWWSPCGHQMTVFEIQMSSSSIRLTKISVEAARPSASRYVIWDKTIPGFGLRVAPSGIKTLILRYRTKGRNATKRFLTLGRFGSTTVDEARTRAIKILGLVADGQDPAAKANDGTLTVKECTQLFLSQHVLPKRKPNTIALYHRNMEEWLQPQPAPQQPQRAHADRICKPVQTGPKPEQD